MGPFGPELSCTRTQVFSRNTFRLVCHAVGALYVWSDLANLEVLHVFHAVDHFLRLLAERIECAL